MLRYTVALLFGLGLALAVAPAHAGEPCLGGTYVGSGTLNGVPISFTTTFSAVDYNFGGLDYTGPAGSGSAAYVVSLGDHSILVTLADGTTLRGRLALFFGPLAHAIVWETAEHGFAGSSIRVDYQRPAATQ